MYPLGAVECQVRDLSIKARLGLCFALMVLLISAMALFSLNQCANMHQSLEQVARGSYLKASAASEAYQSLLEVYHSIDSLLISDDPDVYRRETEQIEVKRRQYREQMQTLDRLETSAKGRALLDRMRRSVAPATELNDRVIKLALEHQRDNASRLVLAEGAAIARDCQNAFGAMQRYQTESVELSYQEASASYAGVRQALWAACLIAAAIALVSSLLVTRGITRPIDEMRGALQEMAHGQGDLTRRLAETSRDEVGEACRLFNIFIGKLHGIVSQLADTAAQVTSESGQLLAISGEMVNGGDRVASQISTVATASEEMAATSTDIARNCLLAADGAAKVETSACESSYVVMESVNIMNTISEQMRESAAAVGTLGQHSEQIGAIVSTIEEIADQTNLLALNAAIEAARAGDQGRGFAVVAGEVRALAERTTRATGEISAMIRAIQKETRKAVSLMDVGVAEVERGVSESARSSEALCEVLSQVSEISAQVSQIAISAEEQTATTNEITANIQQVNSQVLQSTQGALQATEAAAGLSRRAADLQRLVGQFKLA